MARVHLGHLSESEATNAGEASGELFPADRSQGRILLVEHRLAGLWLPPGGHVEPAEHPWATVQREANEELGIFDVRPESPDPTFLTVTIANDAEPHTDVSRWYTMHSDSRKSLAWNHREFCSVRWWTPAEIAAAPRNLFDPHLPRFLAKTWAPSR